MPRRWYELHWDDDLKAMERSTLEAFISPEQKDVLVRLWKVAGDHPPKLIRQAPPPPEEKEDSSNDNT